MNELYDSGLDADEIGEFTAEMKSKGFDTIDWKNLSDEQVELILNEHDCTGGPEDGCAVCQKLCDAGKLNRSDPDEPSLEERAVKAEMTNPREIIN